MTFRRLLILLITTLIAVLLVACGTLTADRAISIAFTTTFAPPTAMGTNSKVSIAAIVGNDSKNLGVIWTVSCGSAQCGSFKPTSTASTMATQFAAPSSIPIGNTVTVTATSAADNTKSVSAIITVTQSAPISVTMNPAPRASMNVGSAAPFTAVVANDSNNAGVNWTVTCTDPQCGSFVTANPVASGSPSTYQAPATVPSDGIVTLTATSVTDNTKSVSATVTITQVTSPLADGTYVFHLSGTDFTTANGQSNYHLAGAFTISGGLIVGGEQDFVDYNNALADSIDPATSNITVTTDGNIRIILDTGDPIIAVNGIETLSASFVSSTRALIAEYDTFASSTGTLDWQNSQAPPSGGYAFLASGVDRNADGIAFGGILNVDGPGSISGTGSVFDFNDTFFHGLVQAQTFSTSTVLGPGGTITPDSFGRVTFTLNPSNSGVGQIVLIGYIVDSATIRLVETNDTLGGTTGGTALSQGGNTGMFTSNSISGTSYVVGIDGIDTNGPLQLAGTVAFDSSSNNVSGNTTLNDIANQLSGNISAGTYLVDTTGRVTLTGLNGPTFQNATIQLYLDGNGNALSLSMDTSDVAAGYAFQQSGGASFNGSYVVSGKGSAPIVSGGSTSLVPWSAVGQVFADGSGNVTGFTDFSTLAGRLATNVQLYGTGTSSGEILTGELTGFGVASSTAADGFTYYIIDGFHVFGIESDSTQLGMAYFEQPPPSK